MKVPEREKGAALLTVLLLVAVMGAVCAAAMEKLRLATALAANGVAADQARIFAMGLESLVTLTVDDLTARSSGRTTLAGGWNGSTRRYPMPGGGLANASVRDGGNCFNVNSLAQGMPPSALATRPQGVAQFVGLMRVLEVPEGQATRIAAAAADWVDGDVQPNREGAEDPSYTGAATPYRAGNTLFAEVSELRALAGMTPDIYARIRPWLCALPDTSLSPVNVNTLSPEQAPLLAMLDSNRIGVDMARRVIAARPQAGWENTHEFWSQPALLTLATALPGEVQNQPQVRTDWFAVEMIVSLGEAELVETALVDARYRPSRVAVRRWGVDD